MHALKLAVKDLKQIAQGCSNKADCIKKTAGSKYPKIPEIILNTDLPAPLYCDPAVCNRENPPGNRALLATWALFANSLELDQVLQIGKSPLLVLRTYE